MSTSRELLDLDPEKPKFLLPTLGTLQEASEKAGFCVYVKVGCFVAWLLCSCMFLASFNVAYCLWSFDCWRLSRFLFLFLSLFFLLLLFLLWLWWWWCFLFARNNSSFRWSIGMSEHYLVYAMYAVVCPSGIIRSIPCNCRHIILSQLSFLFHWLIQLVAFFLSKMQAPSREKIVVSKLTHTYP